MKSAQLALGGLVGLSCLFSACLSVDVSRTDGSSCTEDSLPAIQLGGTWTKRISGTLQGLNDVVWTGSRFVVTGYFDTLLTSEDGVTWQAIGIPARMHAVAWNGDSKCSPPPAPRLVAVGNAGTILSSMDGLTWTTESSGTLNLLWAVEWTGTQFVAVGTGGVILTSTDGIAWMSRSSWTTATLRDVAWNDSMIVVVGDLILSSPDGVTWTLRDTENNDGKGLNWVSWSGSGFTANNPGSRPTVGGYTVHSPEGVSWTRGISFESDKPFRFGNQFVTLGGTSDVVGEAVITVWPRMEGEPSHQYMGVYFTPLGVAWTGNRLVVVGSGGTIMTMP
jgi:hypothetical protein